MRIIEIEIILVFFICCLNPSKEGMHGINCGGYYRRSKTRINGEEYNYCWIFGSAYINANYAKSRCRRKHGSRLTTVATAGKASKLSQFIKENVRFYASGGRGNYSMNIFKNGWLNGEILVSGIKDGLWDSTQREVTNVASEEAKIKNHGSQCVVFSHSKSTWRYADCSEKHPYICEESGHVYPDDVNADDWTTPSVTLPPTTRHPKGLKLTCPEGYDEFRKHCFYIGKVWGSLAAAEKTCNKTGGTQVWISDSSKDILVHRYYWANKKKFKGRAFLGRLTGNGYIIKWKGTGTNARYVLNKYHFSRSKDLKYGIMPQVFMNSKGLISHCGKGCRARPFCESTRIVPGSRDNRLTSVLAAPPTKSIQLELNNKNNNRQKSETLKSKPLQRNDNFREIIPRKSKPVHRKSYQDKTVPKKSKSVDREDNHGEIISKKSKIVNTKNYEDQTVPMKSKAVDRQRSRGETSPQKSKPVNKGDSRGEIAERKPKPVGREDNRGKTIPKKLKIVNRKLYQNETVPIKSKQVDMKDGRGETTAIKLKPVVREDRRAETLPDISKPVNREDSREETTARKSKPIDIIYKKEETRPNESNIIVKNDTSEKTQLVKPSPLNNEDIRYNTRPGKSKPKHAANGLEENMARESNEIDDAKSVQPMTLKPMSNEFETWANKNTTFDFNPPVMTFDPNKRFSLTSDSTVPAALNSILFLLMVFVIKTQTLF